MEETYSMLNPESGPGVRFVFGSKDSQVPLHPWQQNNVTHSTQKQNFGTTGSIFDDRLNGVNTAFSFGTRDPYFVGTHQNNHAAPFSKDQFSFGSTFGARSEGPGVRFVFGSKDSQVPYHPWQQNNVTHSTQKQNFGTTGSIFDDRLNGVNTAFSFGTRDPYFGGMYQNNHAAPFSKDQLSFGSTFGAKSEESSIGFGFKDSKHNDTHRQNDVSISTQNQCKFGTFGAIFKNKLEGDNFKFGGSKDSYFGEPYKQNDHVPLTKDNTYFGAFGAQSEDTRTASRNSNVLPSESTFSKDKPQNTRTASRNSGVLPPESAFSKDKPQENLSSGNDTEPAGISSTTSSVLPMCVFCFSKEREYLFYPCGHLIVCEDCTYLVENHCPLCKKYIQHKVKAYIS